MAWAIDLNKLMVGAIVVIAIAEVLELFLI